MPPNRKVSEENMRWFIIFTLMLIACAPSNPSSRVKSKGSRNIITTEEIVATSAINAYEVIRFLRPHLLDNRRVQFVQGRMKTTEPIVFVNGFRYGGFESLKDIVATGIKEINYLSPTNPAASVYGNYSGGVFVITTK